MKDLIEYLLESKTSKLISQVIKLLGFDINDDKDLLDKLEEFFNKHNTKEVEFLATKETLEDNEFPKSVIKYYNTDEKEYDQMVKDFKSTQTLYSESDSFSIKVTASDNVISIEMYQSDPIYIVCK